MISTPIQIYIKDRPKTMRDTWQLGIWDYTEKTKVWGLVFDGKCTHMCYSLIDSPPLPAITERRKKFELDPDPIWLCWYFDVGRGLNVTLDDLERCLAELGIRREIS